MITKFQYWLNMDHIQRWRTSHRQRNRWKLHNPSAKRATHLCVMFSYLMHRPFCRIPTTNKCLKNARQPHQSFTSSLIIFNLLLLRDDVYCRGYKAPERVWLKNINFIFTRCWRHTNHSVSSGLYFFFFKKNPMRNSLMAVPLRKKILRSRIQCATHNTDGNIAASLCSRIADFRWVRLTHTMKPIAIHACTTIWEMAHHLEMNIGRDRKFHFRDFRMIRKAKRHIAFNVVHRHCTSDILRLAAYCSIQFSLVDSCFCFFHSTACPNFWTHSDIWIWFRCYIFLGNKTTCLSNLTIKIETT